MRRIALTDTDSPDVVANVIVVDDDTDLDALAREIGQVAADLDDDSPVGPGWRKGHGGDWEPGDGPPDDTGDPDGPSSPSDPGGAGEPQDPAPPRATDLLPATLGVYLAGQVPATVTGPHVVATAAADGALTFKLKEA